MLVQHCMLHPPSHFPVTRAGSASPPPCGRRLPPSSSGRGTPLYSWDAAAAQPCNCRRVLQCIPQPAGVQGAVEIGRRTFHLLGELGHGCSAVVFEAREQGAPSCVSVALKQSRISGAKDFARALFEAQTLKALTESLVATPDLFRYVPQYYTHGVDVDVRGKPCVSLVMSKVEGCPLDQWLYGMDDKSFKTTPIAVILDGPFPDGNFATQSLDSACALASTMMEQSARVLAALSVIAYHRDLSSHNVIVRGNAMNSSPQVLAESNEFAIIDFGFAVSSHAWRQEWRSANVAGDPRYWSPAAWMCLMLGRDYLSEHSDQGLLTQYHEGLDHFPLGVLTLELFFALWWGPTQESCPDAFAQVQAAWREYWAHANALFQELHRGVDLQCERLQSSDDIAQLMLELAALRIALRHAASSLQVSRPAFARLLSLIASLLEVRPRKAGLPSWSKVLDELRGCKACLAAEFRHVLPA